jgi:5-bromo-4-chloroindolyl phosphate hydrolysis protein
MTAEAMGESEARIVKNEALFREVNEQIDTLNDAGPQAESLPIVCECGSASCSEVIRVDRHVYEAVRSHSERFLIAPGHEIDAVEDVVEQTETFTVVAKKPGGPRRLAEETDPRQ